MVLGLGFRVEGLGGSMGAVGFRAQCIGGRVQGSGTQVCVGRCPITETFRPSDSELVCPIHLKPQNP